MSQILNDKLSKMDNEVSALAQSKNLLPRPEP